MKAKHPKMDHKLIALTESWERQYWKKRLGVPIYRLQAAVKAVGHSVRKVKQYIEEENMRGEP